MDFLVISLLLLPFVALIPAKIASNKGRSFVRWWVYGVLLFLVAFIHSLLLQEKTKDELPSKLCPACAEKVNISANLCRHCGYDFLTEGFPSKKVDLANVSPVVSTVMPSMADEIGKLATLRDQGILTDDEFRLQKTKLLALPVHGHGMVNAIAGDPTATTVLDAVALRKAQDVPDWSTANAKTCIAALQAIGLRIHIRGIDFWEIVDPSSLVTAYARDMDQLRELTSRRLRAHG